MKGIRQWVSDGWHGLAVGAAVILVIGGLFFFRLGSLTPGFSQIEVGAVANASHFKDIAHNPYQAPYRVLVYGLHFVGWQSPLAIRLVSVLFALIVIFSFYLLLKLWTSPLVSVLGTALLLTSSWLLHYARLGVPDIAYGCLFIVIALGVSLGHSRWRKLVLVGFVASGALLLYLPGMVWFVLVGLVWRRKLLASELKQVSIWFTLLLLVLFGVILAPLTWALVKDPALLRLFAGLPEHLPTVFEFIRRLFNVPFQLFIRGPANPSIWLGRLPLLDIFSSVMALIGLYVICRKWRFDRSKLLLGILALGAVLVALGGAVQITLLLPFTYCLITIGIAYMLEQWLSVFPRNPLARNIGISLMAVGVVLACFYNAQQYFVAWRHAPITTTTFQKKLPN